jgi:putative ABC transport system permease protein
VTPPRLPLLLLQRLLPRSLREPIAGDLEEEWRRAARPSPLRFWNLALRSIASCWIDRLRRDHRRRPRPQHVNPPGDSVMQSLMQDVRYGLRLLWRNPVFTIAAVVTLALGIGANAAIFSIVNVLSLKPLPYEDPSRVAFVLGWDLEENDMRFNLRHADFLDLQRESTSLELSAYSYVSANLTGGEVPDRVQAYRVTPNTFSLLGVPAEVGRVFENADAAAGRFDVAVISHGLWQRGFGGDRSIVGRRIVVNGQPYEVIGVMPRRFEYPVFNFKGDLWIPWRMADSERGQAAATGSATAVARLRPGVSYAQAQSEVDVLMRGFADRYPATNRGLGARLTEMGKLDDEQAGPAIAILLITVAMVLVLACANVANLLLARGVARHRELAVRAAMGASRLRLGRQLIAEAGLLAAAGGALGVVFSLVALEGIRASLPEMLLATVPNISELGVDRTTLAYTLGISVLTSLMFGVVPAWRASRDRFENALKESASAGGSRGTRRLRTTLVIAEVALATMLLVTAGLLVRSYGSLQRVSPGFVAANVMTAALTLPEHKYANAASRQRFFEQLLERVERLPGVTASGLVNVLPFSTYDRGSRLVIDGAPIPDPGREPPIAFRVASPGYHEAMGIPLTAGRMFDRRDTPDGERVAIVNRRTVEQHFGGQWPLGRRIRLGDAEQPWLTIVGVVGDVRHSSLTRAPQPEVYVPMSQSPAAMMMLAVRTAARPEDLTSPMRAVVQDIDPEQPIYHVKTLDALVGDALLPSRTSASMVTLFSGLALILAAIGIYGVVAYGVSQQAREFGVRMALGATPRDVMQLVLRHGLMMIGTGVALGIAGALGVSGLLRGALHGVSSTDPGTYAVAAVVLAMSGVAACALPAWRASATKPVSALRAD